MKAVITIIQGQGVMIKLILKFLPNDFIFFLYALSLSKFIYILVRNTSS